MVSAFSSPPLSEAADSLKLAAVVPIGPSLRDRERLAELLASFAAYAPWVGPFIIVNDGHEPAPLVELLAQNGLIGEVIAHPRAGLGHPWRGRLTTGLFHAYSLLRETHPGHHVLKIDTDALVLRPFQAQLAALLRANPDSGLIGSTDHSYVTREDILGTRLPGRFGQAWNGWETAPRSIYRLTRFVSRLEVFPWIQFQVFGARAAVRRLIRRAHAQGYGYVWGQQINGGVYLLTAEANRRFGLDKDLTHPGLLARDDWFGEDTLVSIAIYATGLGILKQFAPGDLIHSRWKGLPGANLDELAARDHALIHSLKDRPPHREADTHAYFRARRGQAPVSPRVAIISSSANPAASA